MKGQIHVVHTHKPNHQQFLYIIISLHEETTIKKKVTEYQCRSRVKMYSEGTMRDDYIVGHVTV